MKTMLAVSLALICCIAHPQDPHRAVIQHIEQSGVFAFGGIGYAGHTSEGEKDFWAILSQSADVAGKDFEEIYANGNPEAKSYALAGIRQLDQARFKELLQSLNGSQVEVGTMEGCIMESRLLAKVAEEIDSGQYDSWLRHRKPTR